MSDTIMSETRKIERKDCLHLSDVEWAALVRLGHRIGNEGVASMLSQLSQEDQHKTVNAAIQSELAESQAHLVKLHRWRQQAVPPAAPAPRQPDIVKIDVARYNDNEAESLLRWLVELEAAIVARNITDSEMQVTFAMSNFAGRAKKWAYGRRLSDSACFPDYAAWKMELRAAFEPPKTEFRARSEFLELHQGKRDMHAYAQVARDLASRVVSFPIDDHTQANIFVKGLVDGPIKTYLFREYPDTLEKAISIALQEDFSLRQAHMHSSAYRAPRSKPADTSGPEPMDLSVAESGRSQQSKGQRRCKRCQKLGHFAYECLAPRPARAAQAGQSQKPRQRAGGDSQRRNGRPKNGQAPSSNTWHEWLPKRAQAASWRRVVMTGSSL